MGKKGRKREHGLSVVINGSATDEKDGCSSLWNAADKGRTDTCEILLAMGADENRAKTSNGMTPLYRAAANGHEDTCRLLLSRDAEIDLATRDGLTPVYVACQNNHHSTMKLLLEHGAKASSHCGYHHGAGTMLYIAANRGDTEICNMLLQRGAYVNTGQCPSITPLFAAASMGHTATCATLLAHGARLDNFQQPLHIAALHGREETCRLLLSHCVGELSNLVNKADFNGRNPLSLATLHDRHNICAAMLEHGAESHFSYPTLWRDTLLRAATNKHSYGMCKLLLMHSSGLATDESSPLNLAV